uniref:Uncharacterized protein n=1 Tax=Anguilla anguilla TaxID=7936 RepID=A0A0E9PBF0_ANGAN
MYRVIRWPGTGSPFCWEISPGHQSVCVCSGVYVCSMYTCGDTHMNYARALLYTCPMWW